MANDVVSLLNDSNKRAIEDEQLTQTPRKKLKGLQPLSEKNPVAILNDLRNGLKYELVEIKGPQHEPIFTISVVVDSQEYLGSGMTKKLAKRKAAEQALKSFIQFPNNCKVILSTSPINSKLDFTSDVFEGAVNGTCEKTPEVLNNKVTTEKNAVMVVNDMYPTAKYVCTETSDIFAAFRMTLEVNGQSFIGTGSSKKKAKKAAATAALNKLFHNKDDIPTNVALSLFRQTSNTYEEQQLADRIGRLVTDKFVSLMGNDNWHVKRKVLAGIVMSRDSQLEVISVATGTKCVSGESLSMSGCNLNDMHAEIVSRRCLKLFLFDQLFMLSKSGEEAEKSIFVQKPEGFGYTLKPGIEFHLYINTAPCGDARIFGPIDSNFIDRHPNKSSRGCLRVKIESGEGTLPAKKMSNIQTWDGVIQGERLLTMSCSDKIARWNVLGLQGCLLAHFIDPIYIKTLTLGSLFNKFHLHRAVCGRISDTLQGLSPPYKLNRPAMCSISSTESRRAEKARNFCVNWTLGQETAEIVKTNTGQPDVGISRVCKAVFAGKFVELCKTELKPITDFKLDNVETYSDAKELSSMYKSAKDRLFEAFVKAQLGHWLQKPFEQDQFMLDSKEVMEFEGFNDVQMKDESTPLILGEI